MEYWESSKVSFDSYCLYFLNPSFEVPGTVRISQYASSLRVILCTLSSEEHCLSDWNCNRSKVRRWLLRHADQVIVLIKFPLVKRILGTYRQLLPANQTVRILAVRLPVPAFPIRRLYTIS